MEEYEVIVIGAGPGGYVAALRAAQKGLKTAVVEKEYVGGVCLNRGCIPTKTLLESARQINTIKKAGEFGINVSDFQIDCTRIWQRKNQIVENLRKGIEYLFKVRGVNFIKGQAKLIDKDTVEVKSDSGILKLKVKNIIIATGSSPSELPIAKFDSKRVLSSDDLLELNRIPKSLIIVGGGVIGCEFACLFSSLGTKITIVELLKNLLPQEDPEISKALEVSFKKKNIQIMTNTKIEAITLLDNGVEANFSDGTKVEAELCLICVGRRPNSQELGLDNLDLILDRGWVRIDDYLRTKYGNIYAIGDVTGKILLAHVAFHQAEIAIENILGQNKKMDYSVVPNCIFTFPEIASVGITEAVAQELGLDYTIAKFPFRALGKAHATGETEGFLKVLIDKKDETMLGAHIIGPGATELIAGLAMAMKNKLKLRQIIQTIYAHPTFSEIIPETIFTFFNLPLHII